MFVSLLCVIRWMIFVVCCLVLVDCVCASCVLSSLLLLVGCLLFLFPLVFLLRCLLFVLVASCWLLLVGGWLLCVGLLYVALRCLSRCCCLFFHACYVIVCPLPCVIYFMLFVVVDCEWIVGDWRLVFIFEAFCGCLFMVVGYCLLCVVCCSLFVVYCSMCCVVVFRCVCLWYDVCVVVIGVLLVVCG